MNDDEYRAVLWRARLALAEFDHWWGQRTWAITEFMINSLEIIDEDQRFAQSVRQVEDETLQQTIAKLSSKP